ncbi:DUF6046 domain-containing protein [Polaribacter undariae]|uniref:DUF6046 domain-containing protein n=1 Tax=Polaribacter sejongensis TaxID=985043 RepID=A0AAJ1R0S5_9FLAO|nr:DUF6046 domain-containing protein [Polaribacter undariae]MDN3621348.1 DUF6046 domain-containing protein [Polaribacter undariae]UWD31890.1 DUF6046 domain-containing protein [Polaribacter undariae]
MAFKVNIPELFKSHFGFDVKVAALKELIGGVDAKDISVTEGRDKMVNGVPVDRYSAMGTPIFDYIKVEKGNYYDWDGKLKTIDEYQFPYECVVELNQPSIIEETYLKGRRSGSVKEIIGLDDFYITIRGFIINYETSNYPTDVVNQFIKLISTPAALNIESPFLSLFDINEMVIFDRNIPQIEGSLHYQPFTLMCKSNIPYTLEV